MDLFPSLDLDLPPLPSDWKEILYENLNFGTLPAKKKMEDVVRDSEGDSEHSDESESSVEDVPEDTESLEFSEPFHEMLKKALELRIDKNSMREDSVFSPEGMVEEKEFSSTVDSILKTLEDVSSEPTDDEGVHRNSLLKICAVKSKFESLILEILNKKDSDNEELLKADSEDIKPLEMISEDVEDILEAPESLKTAPEDLEDVGLLKTDSDDFDDIRDDLTASMSPRSASEDLEDVELPAKDSEDVGSILSLIENVLEGSQSSQTVLEKDSAPEVVKIPSEFENLFGPISQSSKDVPKELQLLEDIQKLQSLASMAIDNTVNDPEEANSTLDFYEHLERVSALADELFDLISAAASESSPLSYVGSESSPATPESPEDVPESSEFAEVVTEAVESSAEHEESKNAPGASNNLLKDSEVVEKDSEDPDAEKGAPNIDKENSEDLASEDVNSRIPRFRNCCDYNYDFHSALDQFGTTMENARMCWTVTFSESESEEDLMDSDDDFHDSDVEVENSESPEGLEDVQASIDAPGSHMVPEASEAPESTVDAPEFLPRASYDDSSCESSELAPESPKSSTEFILTSKWNPDAPEFKPRASKDGNKCGSSESSMASCDVPESQLTPDSLRFASKAPGTVETSEEVLESAQKASRYEIDCESSYVALEFPDALEDLAIVSYYAPKFKEFASEPPSLPPLTIQIPPEFNFFLKIDGLLEDHLPLHILQKKKLLAEETHQFLVTSFILQSQQATKNALLSLENSKYPDFDDLRVRELPISFTDFNVPRRIQWQFIDFYARVNMFKARNLVIQCQNAAGNSKKSIEELRDQRLWEKDGLESRRDLMMVKTEKLEIPDSIMRLHYDVAQQIARFQADVFVIQSQLASRNALLPLSSIENPNFTLPSIDVSTMLASLGFSRVVPNVIKNQLESIINQCQLYIYRQLVLCDQNASRMNSTMWSEGFSNNDVDEQSTDSSTQTSTFTSLQDRLLEDTDSLKDPEHLAVTSLQLRTSYNDKSFSESEENRVKSDSEGTCVKSGDPMRKSL